MSICIDPLTKIKTAKHIAPAIFTNKTPKFHIRILDFLNDTSKYKAICIFRGGGKTTNINKIDMFSKIFYEHEPFIQIFSSTKEKAESFLSDIQDMVISAMSTGYDISKGRVWNKREMELVVDGVHKIYIRVYGAGQDPRGGTKNFGRPTLQIFDDIESNQGQYAIGTKQNRIKLKKWFDGECIPSLDPIYGKVIFIGTILHEDSLLNNILKKKKYKRLIIPILTASGKSAWPDRHPLTKEEARIKEKEILAKTGERVEIESIEEIKAGFEEDGKLKLFYQEYLCKAQSEEARLFKENYFKYYSHIEYSDKIKYLHFKNALEKKKIPIREPLFIVKEDGSKIPILDTVRYSTMDLAGSTLTGDNSVIITCAYDSSNNMYVLPISAGHWTPFDKSINVLSVYKEYKPQTFGIEKAGMQNEFFYTVDEAQKAMNIRVPVEPLSHGGVNKNIRIANLEPLFIVGKVHFCRKDPFTSNLESQFLAFDIDVEGEDDFMDTLAYQHYFIKGRTFEEDDYEEEEETAW